MPVSERPIIRRATTPHFVCTADGCGVTASVAVFDADGGWCGSACCDNEQHMAEVIADLGNSRVVSTLDVLEAEGFVAPLRSPEGGQNDVA